jgi:S1-C subfamily serine protease
LGEEVYAFGFPLNKLLGHDLKLTNGTVNSKNGFQGEFSKFQFSANIYPGNSGGPLVSKDAEVIGITVAKLKGTEMINYAIKIDYLLYLAKSIDGYNYSNYFDSKKQVTGLPNSAENISKYVFNICGN